METWEHGMPENGSMGFLEYRCMEWRCGNERMRSNQNILGLEVEQSGAGDAVGVNDGVVVTESQETQPRTHLLTSPLTHLCQERRKG